MADEIFSVYVRRYKSESPWLLVDVPYKRRRCCSPVLIALVEAKRFHDLTSVEQVVEFYRNGVKLSHKDELQDYDELEFDVLSNAPVVAPAPAPASASASAPDPTPAPAPSNTLDLYVVPSMGAENFQNREEQLCTIGAAILATSYKHRTKMNKHNEVTQYLLVAAQMSGSGKTELGVTALEKLKHDSTLLQKAAARAQSHCKLPHADLSKDIDRLQRTKLVYVSGEDLDLEGADINTVCAIISKRILKIISALLLPEQLNIFTAKCENKDYSAALEKAGRLLHQWDVPIFIFIDEFDYVCGYRTKFGKEASPSEAVERLYDVRTSLLKKFQLNGWPVYIAGRGSYLYVMGRSMFLTIGAGSPSGTAVERIHLPPLNVQHIYNILCSTLKDKTPSLTPQELRRLSQMVFRLTRGVPRLITWVSGYVNENWSNVHSDFTQGKLSEKSFSQAVVHSLEPTTKGQLHSVPKDHMEFLLILIRMAFYKLPIKANADAPQKILDALGLRADPNQPFVKGIPMSEFLRFMNVHFMSCDEYGRRPLELCASSGSLGAFIDEDETSSSSAGLEPPAKRRKLGEEEESSVSDDAQQQTDNDDAMMVDSTSTAAMPHVSSSNSGNYNSKKEEAIFVRVFFPQMMLDALAEEFGKDRKYSKKLWDLAEYARRFDNTDDIEFLRTGTIAERILACVLYNHLALGVWMAEKNVPLSKIFPFLCNTDIGARLVQQLSLSPFPKFREGEFHVPPKESNKSTYLEKKRKHLIASLPEIRKRQVTSPVSEFGLIWNQPCFPSGCLMRCWPQSRSCDVFYKVDDEHVLGFACKSATTETTEYGVNVLIDEMKKGFIQHTYFPSCKRQIIVAVFLSLQHDLSDLEYYEDAEQPSSISWANLEPNSTQSKLFELVRDERGTVTAFRFKPGFEFRTTTGTKQKNTARFKVPEHGEVFVFTNAGLQQFFGSNLLELLRGAEAAEFRVAFEDESDCE